MNKDYRIETKWDKNYIWVELWLNGIDHPFVLGADSKSLNALPESNDLLVTEVVVNHRHLMNDVEYDPEDEESMVINLWRYDIQEEIMKKAKRVQIETDRLDDTFLNHVEIDVEDLEYVQKQWAKNGRHQ